VPFGNKHNQIRGRVMIVVMVRVMVMVRVRYLVKPHLKAADGYDTSAGCKLK